MSAARAAPFVVGIDPGARATGIVVRCGDELLWADTPTRATPPHLGTLDLGAGYLTQVRQVLDAAVAEAHDAGDGQGLIAVEGIHPPTPHLGFTNITGLLGAAMILGMVLARHPGAVVVPPSRHGAGPLAAYPATLRPARGQGAGRDRHRHCRSAWDVAGAAVLLWRRQQAERQAKPA